MFIFRRIHIMNFTASLIILQDFDIASLIARLITNNFYVREILIFEKKSLFTSIFIKTSGT